MTSQEARRKLDQVSQLLLELAADPAVDTRQGRALYEAERRVWEVSEELSANARQLTRAA